MPTVLNGIPGSIVAGDSLVWAETWPDYDVADWTVTATFRLTDGKLRRVEGVGSGTDWTFTLNAPQSAEWTPGLAEWFQVARNAQERIQIRRGLIRIAPDPEQEEPSTDLDREIDFLKVALANVEATILARTAGDKSERYTVGGQSQDKTPLVEVYNMRKKLQIELKTKRARKRRLASGLPSRRAWRTTFGG